MLSRILYAIREGWRYRAQLGRYYTDRQLQLASIFDLTPALIQQQGIKVLILDYDGVLAAHGEPVPRPEAVTWLQGAKARLGVDKIYILSNKPKLERLQYFQHNFPEIIFVIAPRKKPYPDGLQQILQDAKVEPAQALLLDDRIGTGVLAATIAGVQALFITKPYINLKGQTIKELGTMLLRWLEKTSLSCCGTRLPKN